MPHYYDDDWAERRAEDSYYEYLENACECPWGYDENNEPEEPEEPCHHCVRRAAEEAAREETREWRAEQERKFKEAALAANPWRDQIVSIKAQLNAVETAKGLGEKLPAIRILLTNLLNQQAFISAQPKFRATLANKMVEFRGDPKAEPLVELLDHVDTMLEKLKERDDFVA
jgi:hypothetical protein